MKKNTTVHGAIRKSNYNLRADAGTNERLETIVHDQEGLPHPIRN